MFGSQPDLNIFAQNWVPKLPFSGGFTTLHDLSANIFGTIGTIDKIVLAKLYELWPTNG